MCHRSAIGNSNICGLPYSNFILYQTYHHLKYFSEAKKECRNLTVNAKWREAEKRWKKLRLNEFSISSFVHWISSELSLSLSFALGLHISQFIERVSQRDEICFVVKSTQLNVSTWCEVDKIALDRWSTTFSLQLNCFSFRAFFITSSRFSNALLHFAPFAFEWSNCYYIFTFRFISFIPFRFNCELCMNHMRSRFCNFEWYEISSGFSSLFSLPFFGLLRILQPNTIKIDSRTSISFFLGMSNDFVFLSFIFLVYAWKLLWFD